MNAERLLHQNANQGVVAGVDVGSEKKGFHAVALREGAYLDHFWSPDPSAVAAWCVDVGARAIGVDAPCRWSLTGRARPAERELMKQRTWCFSSPTREAAIAHPKKQFSWMLNGERLYHELEKSHTYFDGSPCPPNEPLYFETFPHAIACALAGKVLSAKHKTTDRRALLQQASIDIQALRNIDTVDAALCALTAHRLLANQCAFFGELETGIIVVPQ